MSVIKTVANGSKGLFWLGCLALSACGDNDHTLGEQDNAVVRPQPSSLTRFEAEQPGENCAHGGQALLVGLDEDRDGELSDDEVSSSAYVCNGAAPKLALSTIAVGDPRCTFGGSAFVISDSDGEQEALACNGATGATGATGAMGLMGLTGAQGADGVQGAQGAEGPQGAQGAQGPQGLDGAQGPQGAQGMDGAQGPQGVQGSQGSQGAQGPQGPAAPQPVFGQFFATQIARGAVLTCTSVAATATTATCAGPKLNGLDIRLAGVEAQAICNAVTGKGFNTASGMGSTNSYTVWNGTNWTYATSGASPMLNINCER